MTVNIEVQNGKVEQSPLDTKELSTLLNETLENKKNEEENIIKNELKTVALTKLNSNSSQYKYIISITSLTTNGDTTDAMITNDVGALWSPKKDGLVNFQLVNSATNTQYLITIFFIFK
ncbi:Topoisomerase I damage affected protein 2 [Maudiozyma exigua]|uniref:Topoisomerase I damage affected protein 2 n=1 Tax=Maudiozyma exigua TaxID=34358 RepID=A0A9P6W4T4_MAUEX|nr:Topoisomerase I damage affected protein 2 [Kazachstania exigua]